MPWGQQIQSYLPALAISSYLCALALVVEVSFASSQQLAGSNSSVSSLNLTPITERASNGRHVSGPSAAAGTTAVATASLLAGASSGSSQAPSGSNSAPYASATNTLESSNRPFTHQGQNQNQNQNQNLNSNHHHNNQQQQQIQAAHLAGLAHQTNQANQQQQQPQQPQQQPSQYNNGQQAVPPLHASTFVFNPQTGQFGANGGADFATTNALASLNSQIANPNQIIPHQQQQPQLFPYQRHQVPYFVAQTGYNQLLQQQQPNFITTSQQRYNQQFNRRNGLTNANLNNHNNAAFQWGGSASQASRLGANSLNLQQPQLDLIGLDLESNGNFNGAIYPQGLLQQQQPQIGSFDLSGAFGGSNLAGSNTYQIGASLLQNQHNHQSQQQQQQHFNGELASLDSGNFQANRHNVQQASNEQCIAADNRLGTCYHASECIRRGGTPMGKCGSADIVASGGGPSNGSPLNSGNTGSVCCLFDVTCGQFAAERFVYFRNPNYPNAFEGGRMCQARIGKLDKQICQMRLDLLRFDVAKPTNGNCSQDMFVVSGQNENYVIPKICGLNDGQHYYVGVDESGVITLHMMMMGHFYRRSFEILISQIPCRSDHAAPAHCLQHYTGTHGTIKSFNYEDEQQSGVGGQNINNYDLMQDGSSSLSLTAPYSSQMQQYVHQRQQQNQLFQGLPTSAAQFGARQGSYVNSGELHFAGYPNDLDYTMCIRKESGFCSITYQLSRGELGLQPFGVGQSWQQQHPYGSQGNSSSIDQLESSAGGWHQMSNECRDDYLLVGGVRLCSGSQFSLASNGQFSHNNGAIGVQQQQLQLQNQYAILMQQLARIQQQQAAGGAGNGTSTSGLNNLNGVGLQQQQGSGNNLVSGNGLNLEQQQGAILQQAMLIQQQLALLAQQSGQNGASGGNRFSSGAEQLDPTVQQGNIITDTTSGPFILRFVSNVARNARGFHIDYRQNPCK